jgi:hypothetical protein
MRKNVVPVPNMVKRPQNGMTMISSRHMDICTAVTNPLFITAIPSARIQ